MQNGEQDILKKEKKKPKERLFPILIQQDDNSETIPPLNISQHDKSGPYECCIINYDTDSANHVIYMGKHIYLHDFQSIK